MLRLSTAVFLLSSTLLPAQGFAAAAAYSKEHAGLAVLVYQQGKLVFEEYQNGHRAGRAHHIYSGTKSFAPIIALVAQAEGLLKLDEKVADTIEEWRDDPRKAKITIRHLLQFTSGLRNIDRLIHSARSRDKYRDGVQAPAVAEPGKRFRYGSVHLMVFGELMRRKLSAKEGEGPKDVLAYLRQKVLDPIGMKVGFWLRDAKGNPLLPYGAFLTAREWAKFGLLILNGGKHGDRQLVPAKELAQCFVGSEANGVYGLNWWLEGRRGKGVPKDTVGAYGMFKQKLYVIPSKQMVVVRLGKINTASRYADQKFLRLLLAPGEEKQPRRKQF